MDETALMLARVQFAFTVSFHIIFPAITIGLASFLALLEYLWLRTAQPVYKTLYVFWSRIFALNFGMGVVAGLVLAYEFGTNWAGFSNFAGSITGPLLAYEVLTAFFLEAGFLGVMLFGWDRVGNRLHFFATVMVAIGTLISATWIIASNSWMHTPAGYTLVEGMYGLEVEPASWFEIIFNPSFPYRLVHMVLAAFLSTALMVAASAAWHLLRGNNSPAVRKMMIMALLMLVVTTPLQIIAGDAHGLNTLEHQPAKVAAMEGHWRNGEPGEGVPLILFGWPDNDTETTHFALEIPHLASLILTHSMDGTFKGLSEFPANERPNAAAVFWSFRVMVGLGMLMLLLGLWGSWSWWRGTVFSQKSLLKFTLLMGPSGLIALLAGWFTTELGRQPWVVYGLLRTDEAASAHSVPVLSFTLVLFVVVYFVVFGVGIRYLLRLIAAGPDDLTTDSHFSISTIRDVPDQPHGGK